MQLKIKGKPFIYTHICSEEDRGRELNEFEIKEFVKICLIESLRRKGFNVIEHSPDFNSEADFSFKKHGRTYCGVVIYKQKKEESGKIIGNILSSEFKKIYPNLAQGYYKFGTLPVFYFAEIKCLDSENNKIYAGDRFEINYHPIQCLYKELPANGVNISEYEIYQKYAEAWEIRNVQFFIDYLQPYFSSTSELAFDDVYSKEEFLIYFESQYDKWNKSKTKLSFLLIEDIDTGKKGILFKINDSNSAFLTLEISDFKISRSITKNIPSNYKKWENKNCLSQVHGDHHAPFVLDDELESFLKECMEKSTWYLTNNTDVNFDHEQEINTTVFSLLFENKGIDNDTQRYLSLVALDKDRNVNNFMSAYPYLDGVSILVKILDVQEWDNKIEATVKCRYTAYEEEFDFYFFATDYFFNKSFYIRGNKVEISIAASSGNVKVASKGFDFEGQKAIDFLKKMGKEPKYDKEGNVEPVHISTENMIAFLQGDERFPDTAEFQSPGKKYDEYHYEFWGKENNKTINIRSIVINRETELEIPLYFNDDCNPEYDEPITGVLWLSGRLSNPGIIVNGPKITTSKIDIWLKKSVQLLKYLFPFYNNTFTSYTFDSIFSDFKNIHLEQGYDLRVIKVKNVYSEYFQLYTEPKNAKIYSWVKYENLKSLPDIFSHITVDETKEGICEAFLLFYSSNFFPRFGKYYFERDFYCILKCPVPSLGEKMSLSYRCCPHIEYNKGTGCGYVTVSYRDKEIGLFREVYAFTLRNNKIKFILDGRYEIMPEEPKRLFRNGNDRDVIL